MEEGKKGGFHFPKISQITSVKKEEEKLVDGRTEEKEGQIREDDPASAE